MGRVTLEIPESQVVEWVQQISPTAKQEVLRALIPRLEAFEALVDYGASACVPSVPSAAWTGTASPKTSASG